MGEGQFLIRKFMLQFFLGIEAIFETMPKHIGQEMTGESTHIGFRSNSQMQIAEVRNIATGSSRHCTEEVQTMANDAKGHCTSH